MIASVGKGGGPYQPRAWLAIARQKAETAAAGPSGCCQTPAETARKSAPAATSGPQFSTVIQTMATQGASIRPAHHSLVSGSAPLLAALVPAGQNATKATEVGEEVGRNKRE